MFVVLVGSILTTGLFFQAIGGNGEAPAGFILAISLWLWFTLIFANFSEAMAEGRGKAQAASLRRARKDTPAKKLSKPNMVPLMKQFQLQHFEKEMLFLLKQAI